jgi:CheY-like chemotaxis protein
MLVGMEAAAQSRHEGAPRSVGEHAGTQASERPRVLLIEDEPGIVDFVRRGLEDEGFAVEAAGDGIEGERMALAGSFDAILLDLMLPRRGGLEVLESLRQ